MGHRSLFMRAAWLWASALLLCCGASRVQLQPDESMASDGDQTSDARSVDGSLTPKPAPGGALCVGSLQKPNNGISDKLYITPPSWSPLDAPKSDAETVCGILEKKGLPSQVVIGYAQAQDGALVKHYNRSAPILTQERVLEALRDMFQAAQSEVDPFFMFFFSGHGNAGFFPDGVNVEKSEKKTANKMPYFADHPQRDHRGAMIVQASFEDPPSVVIADFITFDDLLEVWRFEKVFLSDGARFVIMADSCFSGKLVEQLRALCAQNCTGLNMAVQSAGDACQSVHERMSSHGGKKSYLGELTSWWAAKNDDRPHGKRVRWSTVPRRPQFPQYFSTWQQSAPKTGPVRDLVQSVPGGVFFQQRWRPQGAAEASSNESDGSMASESSSSDSDDSDDEPPTKRRVV